MPDPLGGFAYTWPFYLGGVLAYLIGSLPSGLIVARLLRRGDPRAGGSGNIGATNLLRTGGRKAGALTLALDGGKGALAVAGAARFGPDMAVIAAGAGGEVTSWIPRARKPPCAPAPASSLLRDG